MCSQTSNRFNALFELDLVFIFQMTSEILSFLGSNDPSKLCACACAHRL